MRPSVCSTRYGGGDDTGITMSTQSGAGEIAIAPTTRRGDGVARRQRMHARRIDPHLELRIEADADVVVVLSRGLHDRAGDEHPLVGAVRHRARDDGRVGVALRRGRAERDELWSGSFAGRGARQVEVHRVAVPSHVEDRAVLHRARRDIRREAVAAGIHQMLGGVVREHPRRRVRRSANRDAHRFVVAEGEDRSTRRHARRIDDEPAVEREVGARGRDTNGNAGNRAIGAVPHNKIVTWSARRRDREVGEERPVRGDRHGCTIDRQRCASIADRAENKIRVANRDRLVCGWKNHLGRERTLDQRNGRERRRPTRSDAALERRDRWRRNRRAGSGRL